ncbi:hypothetical protein WN48_08101 [Eufriesea mexicana]|uniref:Uncharacterized protein n=1 Tax=Eufriesea mexicana TaxID=516756 RepID=A0A310SBN7_9HYME|nr:hypothetical protein WN48_08101 [Eufriesea mexicana]
MNLPTSYPVFEKNLFGIDYLSTFPCFAFDSRYSAVHVHLRFFRIRNGYLDAV